MYKPIPRKFITGTKSFHLSLLYWRGGYQPEHLGPDKKYRFKITLVAENASAVSQDFEFYRSGAWKDEPNDMFKEISIRKI